MIYYLLIFILNFIFNICKTLEIKYTYDNKLIPLLLNTIVLTGLVLLSTFISLDKLFEGDYLVIPFYIGGSVIGKWFSLKHFENVRYKVSQLLKNKNE